MFLRTLIVWGIGIPVTLFLFPFALIGFLVDRRGNAVHSIGALWSRILLFLSGVHLEVKGIENIPLHGPLIFAANHRGAFDIPVLQARLPVQFRWVAKRGLFKIPFVGWAMSMAGYIGIDTVNASSAMKSIERAADRIQAGTSVVIFPEGTRNEAPALLPFKRGGFLLAVKSGVPVVPVSIEGTDRVMKRGSLFISSAEVRVRIGRPIKTKGADEAGLMAAAKKAIEKGLASL
ncbi:MAG: 1-acyl-sn-glycerol-3-phosphate acyltransferase [Deltaproteobacteria bacterium]|nr:1-acyl-sn-glycerol-3-phosphate acyltransferase [Deltaproteobacteria bacterium]